MALVALLLVGAWGPIDELRHSISRALREPSILLPGPERDFAEPMLDMLRKRPLYRNQYTAPDDTVFWRRLADRPHR